MCISFPNWSALSEIGRNRVLKTSYFWLLVVPVLAKVITKLREFSDLNTELIWLQLISKNLVLPFNWTIFYGSAAAFAFGLLIYNFKCPDLIRDFQSFSEFKACGNGEDALISRYSTWLRKGGKIYNHDDIEVGQDNAIRQFIIDKCINDEAILTSIGNDPAWEVIGGARLKPNLELNAWYYLMVKQMCRDKHISRVIVTIFFIIGFILLAVVLLQNFFYVAKAAFPNNFS